MSIKSLSDKELISKCLSGEERAFTEMMDRYGDKIYSFVGRMIGFGAETDDAVQDIFVKIFKSLDRYEGTRAKFSTWVFAIARNHAIDILRGRKDVVSLDKMQDELGFDIENGRSDVEEIFEKRLTLDRIEVEVSRMREDYREIILLRYLEGLSYKEISEVLDIPIGTVKTNLHRAREHLREKITGDEI